MGNERSDLATWFVVEAEALTANWTSAGEGSRKLLEGRMMGHLVAARHACGVHVGELVQLAYSAGAPDLGLSGATAISGLSIDMATPEGDAPPA